jgi:hypothetical protein
MLYGVELNAALDRQGSATDVPEELVENLAVTVVERGKRHGRRHAGQARTRGGARECPLRLHPRRPAPDC